MLQKKKEIYTKIDNVKEIVEIMEEIDKKQKEIKGLFNRTDNLNFQEEKIYGNWGNYLEEIKLKLDHVIR